MSKTLQVRKEFPYDRIGSYRNVNPFTINFVYPMHGTPFIIKGGIIDVNKWMDDFRCPAMINRTLWWHGIHRSMWQGHRFYLYVTKPRLNPSRASKYGFEIKVQSRNPDSYGKIETIKCVRRMPRKWMKEFNDYV